MAQASTRSPGRKAAGPAPKGPGPAGPAEEGNARSGPLSDLTLTLPIFVGYHLGVIFLPVRNAADLVTRELQELAHHSLPLYLVLTLALGAAWVVPLLLLGRGKHLAFERFAWLGSEGVLYALAMRLLAGWAVARLVTFASEHGGKLGLLRTAPAEGTLGLLRAAPALSSQVEVASTALDLGTRLSGAVMSLGAGFYEELVFRVGLYGVGALLLVFLFNVASFWGRTFLRLGWALATAAVFSGWHHFGELGDPFDLSTFCFRTVCGLVFTVIYQYRGFAPAVWTHALYDLWVLAL